MVHIQRNGRKSILCRLALCLSICLLLCGVMIVALAAEGEDCTHETYKNGVCTACGYLCPHGSTDADGCTICGYAYPVSVTVKNEMKLDDEGETTYYFTLKDAIAAAVKASAKNNSSSSLGSIIMNTQTVTVTLLADLELTDSIEIANSDAEVILVGGEHTVSAACTMFKVTGGSLSVRSGNYTTTGGNVFYISGTVTLPASSGNAVVGGIGTSVGSTTETTARGALNISGGSYSSAGHTVYVTRATESTTSGEAITVYTAMGTASISGGVFTSTEGYAIYNAWDTATNKIAGGDLSVSGGEFNGGLYIGGVPGVKENAITLAGGKFSRVDSFAAGSLGSYLAQHYAFFTADGSGAYTVPTAAGSIGGDAVEVKLCTHVYTNADGVCDICGKSCAHPAWDSATGSCTTCGYGHIHESYDEDGFCTVCGGYQPATANSGYYEIDNAGKLYWFAQQVNSGNTSINGKLTANIVVNKDLLNSLIFDADGNVTNGDSFRQWTPIGNNQYDYEGTFDGNQKTVSGLYYNGCDFYVGLFGCIFNGANIRNVGVVDNYFHVSGGNERTFVYVGGLVGFVCSGGEAITVENCYHTGKVSESTSACLHYIGGLVGYIWSDTRESITLQNCYNTGAVSSTTSGANVGALVGFAATTFETITIQKCYWLNTSANQGIGFSENVSGSGTLATAAEFASGKVAWLLNGGKSAGIWKQTVGSDTSPNFTGGTVYQVYKCDGTISDSVYANSAGKKLPHVRILGVVYTCMGCNRPLVASVTVGETTDYYVTLNEAFAAASGKTATIALLDDTTLTSTIEINDAKSNITLDGTDTWLVDSEYTVSAACAMFKITAGTLTIKNGKYTTTSGNVIEVSGTTADSTTSSGSGSSSSEAGIYTPSTDIGFTIPTTTVGTVNISGGSFTSESGYAVYVGTMGASTVFGNCGKLNVSGGNFGKLYIAGAPTDKVVLTGGSFTGVEFQMSQISGTLCAAILKEGYAFFDGDGNGVKPGKVSSDTAVTVKLCTSHGWDISTGTCLYCGETCTHAAYENGICTTCGAYQSATLNDEGYYEIGNAGQLYWFAQLVDSQNTGAGYGSSSLNAVLTANITVNAGVLTNGVLNSGAFRQWTPIGSDRNMYTGTFDGQGYTVSGLYYSGKTFEYIGLFGFVAAGATVRNVTVTDSYFADNGLRDTDNVGGLVGYLNVEDAGTVIIENCSFCGAVSASCDTYTGGLVGLLVVHSGTVTVRSCSFDGTVSVNTSGNAYAGGLMGKCELGGTLNITNCYATGGEVTATGNNAYAGGLGGYTYLSSATAQLNITNCYAAVNVTASAGSADAYAGGLVGYARALAGTVTVENSYSIGTVGASATGDSSDIYKGGIIGKNTGGTVTNCYYLNAEGLTGIGETEDTTGVEAVTDAQFASGYVAWKLNGEKSDENAVWKQTVGRDTAPNFTGRTVYYEAAKGYYNEDFVSVTVTWTSMEFTYTDGAWNPDAHGYNAGKWTGNGGTVTVENNSNVKVAVIFGYTATAEGIGGSFSKSGFDLDVGASDTTTLTLTGKPDTNLNHERIGSITVTVAKKSE